MVGCGRYFERGGLPKQPAGTEPHGRDHDWSFGPGPAGSPDTDELQSALSPGTTASLIDAFDRVEAGATATFQTASAACAASITVIATIGTGTIEQARHALVPAGNNADGDEACQLICWLGATRATHELVITPIGSTERVPVLVTFDPVIEIRAVCGYGAAGFVLLLGLGTHEPWSAADLPYMCGRGGVEHILVSLFSG